MGALGNSRRGGRLPQLVIGALIACIVVVGFNYWVSNSRNQELQTKLFEMEMRARQAAAERVAVEQKKNDFQEQLRKQSEQITHIASQHDSQLELLKASWREEKENLLFNISSSTKTIQTMKIQFNTLFENLEKIQKELQECQRNGSTLSKKLSADLMQCNTHILVLKEECTAKLAAARREAEQMLGKKMPPSPAHSQMSPGPAKAKTVNATEGTVGKTSQSVPRNSSAEELKASQHTKTQLSLQHSSDVIENREDKVKDRTTPGAAAGPNAGNKVSKTIQMDKKEPVVLDTHGAKGGGVRNDANDAGYMGADQNTGKDQETGHLEADVEEEAADYDGDDENEGEFEADKQAELTDI